jgi:hypothetical protein
MDAFVMTDEGEIIAYFVAATCPASSIPSVSVIMEWDDFYWI